VSLTGIKLSTSRSSEIADDGRLHTHTRPSHPDKPAKRGLCKARGAIVAPACDLRRAGGGCRRLLLARCDSAGADPSVTVVAGEAEPATYRA
jgi:hypothetical protein